MSHVESNRIALIGGGVMGRNHARTIAQNPDQSELAYVADVNLSAARELAAQYGNAATRIVQQLEDIDHRDINGAIIVSPSRFHAEQATHFMNAGIGVLVEKPIAMSVQEASDMKAVSEKTGSPLMVGHIELFNPVVQNLKKQLGGAAIKAIHISRLGNTTDPSRLYHDVVQDLMVHDIAITNYLLEHRTEPVDIISAFGRTETPAAPDPAEAVLAYGNGVSAHLRASRSYSGGKVRRIEVETQSSLLTADLIGRHISIVHADEPREVTDGIYGQTTSRSEYRQDNEPQPLFFEQRHFVECLNGTASPEQASVGVDDAIEVLRISKDILAKIVYARNGHA